MGLIHESEHEDFENAIKDKGFEISDFELSEQRDSPEGASDVYQKNRKSGNH